MTTLFRGFTLVEMLCVIVIILSIAAFLFPALSSAKRAAHKTVCSGNLEQLGCAVATYMADYDDHYPYGINHVERACPGLFCGRPQGADPSNYPDIVVAMREYLKDPKILRCPLDTGRTLGWRCQDAFPTLASHNGGSSYWMAEVLLGQTSSTWPDPSRSTYAIDGLPDWHYGMPATLPGQGVVNGLFYDWHVAAIRSDPGITGPMWDGTVLP